MLKYLATLIAVLIPIAASAQSMDSLQKARDLGNLIASEELCGLVFNQDAIARWIDENTDPADMGFSATLQMMTEGAAFGFSDMSESSKTAHCRSIERTARYFGFIE